VLELGARDQRLDARIGRDVSERFALIGKRDDLVTARFEHAADDQSRGATRIN
jgi:hypothetical protein